MTDPSPLRHLVRAGVLFGATATAAREFYAQGGGLWPTVSVAIIAGGAAGWLAVNR